MSPWCDWGTGCEGPQGDVFGLWQRPQDLESVLTRGPANRNVHQGLGLSLEVARGPLRTGGGTAEHMEGPHWHCCKTWVGLREWFLGRTVQESEEMHSMGG